MSEPTPPVDDAASCYPLDRVWLTPEQQADDWPSRTVVVVGALTEGDYICLRIYAPGRRLSQLNYATRLIILELRKGDSSLFSPPFRDDDALFLKARTNGRETDILDLLLMGAYTKLSMHPLTLGARIFTLNDRQILVPVDVRPFSRLEAMGLRLSFSNRAMLLDPDSLSELLRLFLEPHAPYLGTIIGRTDEQWDMEVSFEPEFELTDAVRSELVRLIIQATTSRAMTTGGYDQLILTVVDRSTT